MNGRLLRIRAWSHGQQGADHKRKKQRFGQLCRKGGKLAAGRKNGEEAAGAIHNQSSSRGIDDTILRVAKKVLLMAESFEEYMRGQEYAAAAEDRRAD